MHPRQAIREKIVELLKGKTDAKERVFSNPTIPEPEKELPSILVFYQTESIEEFNQAPRDFKRTLLLSVQIIESQTEDKDLQDRLDTIAQQVEELVAKDDSLAQTVEDIFLQSVDFDFEGGGGSPIGAVKLLYRILYITGVPASTVSEYEGNNVEWRIGHNNTPPDNITEANDVIDFES